MKIYTDKRVDKKLQLFSDIEQARIGRVINALKEKGFSLNESDLKKLSKEIWELRAGNIRLLFGVVESNAIIVNVFVKKTQKTRHWYFKWLIFTEQIQTKNGV